MRTPVGRWPILLLSGAMLIVAAIFAIFPDVLSPTSPLDRERARRLALAALGRPLAGTPDVTRLDARFAEAGVALGAPVFIRIFKLEFVLELWLKRADRFELFATYPICRWSGGLGPKLVQGDKQAPEGFYAVDARALNPNSRWHRSFNLGFPNAFDRAKGRNGSFLMVHGGCSSVGCYAMTDPVIDEIWRIVTAALDAGQPRFAVHVFPFRMSADNLARHAASPWSGFWSELKAGYDAFEATRLPPQVTVCGSSYAIEPVQRYMPHRSVAQQGCVRRAGIARDPG